MQNVISIRQAQASRIVVVNNPNRLEARLVRKTYNRSEPNVMGMPTLGGLGVVSAEDEEDFEAHALGSAWALEVAKIFQPSTMFDNRDSNYGSEDSFTFLIEPEFLPPHPEAFEPKKGDLMKIQFVVTGTVSVILGFEIVAVETTSNIPPYLKRYICNRRSEFDG